MKKVLIVGNQGYIGPVLQKHLSSKYELFGYDIGFFANNISVSKNISVDSDLVCQYYGDVRDIDPKIFNGIDSVVYLCAISNDPMGNKFREPTLDINKISAIKYAKLAKDNGVNSFVFASSCSVYGTGGNNIKNENSDLDPLTTYAVSKIETENELSKIADDDFNITCLRFATACGFSPRLRLDLVLNDFVASAITNKKIQILSDGTPWRPLINVKDMSRAIEWAIQSYDKNRDSFIIVNAGSNKWNYSIIELAQSVSEIVGGVEIEVNKNASPDKRSYKVDFSLFNEIANDYTPLETLESTINDLLNGISKMNLSSNFRSSEFIRLVHLNNLISEKIIDNNLKLNK
jgi:nucleoside-diphosphate-sugar epimerase